MAFKENSNVQLRIDNPFFCLTKREKKYLKSSWAENFYKNVFSSIVGSASRYFIALILLQGPIPQLM